MSPCAIQLRYLQTLNSISSEKNNTIIFPFPLEMMSRFIKNQKRNAMKRFASFLHSIPFTHFLFFAEWVLSSTAKYETPMRNALTRHLFQWMCQSFYFPSVKLLLCVHVFIRPPALPRLPFSLPVFSDYIKRSDNKINKTWTCFAKHKQVFRVLRVNSKKVVLSSRSDASSARVSSG